MKIHTTNYYNTFIAVAEDCSVTKGEIPPVKKERTIANIEFDLIKDNPYKYTSDDILLKVFMERNNIEESECESIRKQFFSKGQPCFRSSPLTKRYGWGVHFDENGRIALYGCETAEYKNLSDDSGLTILKAMRSKK